MFVRSAAWTGRNVPNKPVLQLTLLFNHGAPSAISPQKPCNPLIVMQIPDGGRLVALTGIRPTGSNRTRVHNMAHSPLSSETSMVLKAVSPHQSSRRLEAPFAGTKITGLGS